MSGRITTSVHNYPPASSPVLSRINALNKAQGPALFPIYLHSDQKRTSFRSQQAANGEEKERFVLKSKEKPIVV